MKNVFHSIVTTTGKPVSLPTRRIPLHQEEEVNKMIQDLLDSGIIERSESPYNSPLVIVKKKSGQLRLCVDFRKLNSITEREIYHIPDCNEIFDHLGGNSFFTTLDLSKGYYQILLDDMSRRKTAFSTSAGHFNFVRLPFGLTSAPASFQNALETILRKERNSKKCCIYIDDIIVYGKTKKEHDKNLLDVLNCLNESGIKLSKEKFVFCKESVKYLGHIISSKGVATDPDKISLIKSWPVPQTMKDLSRFLGFSNYYRKFIKNYSTCANPLESILRRDKKLSSSKIKWNDELAESFESLKSLLSTAPILHTPTKTGKFVLDTDASQTSIAAVLSQVDSQGVERPIYFASNRLSSAEQNYCTTRRELLAIVKYVKFFHHYLAGKCFTIRTDHKSLSWLMTWKTPSTPQYFTWISSLQMYDFDIIHRNGKDHSNADALTRLEDCRRCKVSHIKNLQLSQNMVQDEVQHIAQCIKEKCKPTLSSTFIDRLWKLKSHLIFDDNKLKFVNNGFKLVVLSQSEAAETAKNIHNNLAHVGFLNLYYYVKNIYWCPNLRQICKRICDCCLLCLERKSIKPIKSVSQQCSSEMPLNKIYADIAGPLPMCNSYRYILVLLDSFSNFPVIIPLKCLTSENIAKQIFNKWITIFGAPIQFHSDNAQYFVGKEMKCLFNQFSIFHSKSSPFHPQGNSKVERQMRTIKDMMYANVKTNSSDWVQSIPEIEMILRGAIHDKNGVTPYQYIFSSGMKMFDQQKSIFPQNILNVSNLVEKYVSLHVRSNEKPELKVKEGSLVMAKIFPKTHSILQPRFVGPLKVLKVKSQGNSIEAIDPTGKLIIRNIRDVKVVHFNDHKEKQLQYEPRCNSSKNICVNDEASQSPSAARSQHSSCNSYRRYPVRERVPAVRYGFNLH